MEPLNSESVGAVVDDVEVESGFLFMLVGREQFLMMTLVSLHHDWKVGKSHVFSHRSVFFKVKTEQREETARAMEDGPTSVRLENLFFFGATSRSIWVMDT